MYQILLILIIFLSANLYSQNNSISFLDFTNDDILFYDEFENNDNEWFVGIADDFGCEIKKGKLLMANNSRYGSWAQWKSIYFKYDENYKIETSLRQYSGSSQNIQGLIWGSHDWDNMNCFCISTDGFYKIFKIENGNYSEIKEWKYSDLILPKYYDNVLSISYSNDSTFFFINNEIVCLKNNIEIFGSNCGIFIDGFIKTKVDYFKIYSTENQLNVTGYPITIDKIKILNIKTDENQIIRNPVYNNFYNILYVSGENSEGNFDIFYSKPNEYEFESMQLYKNHLNNKFDNYIINFIDDKSLIFLQGININDTTFSDGISYSILSDNLWSEPKEISIEKFYNNNEISDFYISNDQKYLISSIQTKESTGLNDLYISFLTDKGLYSSPKNLGDKINTLSNEKSAILLSDNKTLFFSSNLLQGFGGFDIFVTQRLDDTWEQWSEPQNLGPKINSFADETDFYIEKNNEFGFFISNKTGNTELYYFIIFDKFLEHLNSQ